MTPFSIYLHIPFCAKRCNYCDFITYAGISDQIPCYIEALCREIQLVGQTRQGEIPVHTVYLGGGTPSLLPTDALDQLFTCLQDNFHFASNMEITMEANPGTLSLQYLSDIRRFGVNRLSIGMQSGLNEELKLLGRIHCTEDAQQCVAWVRKAGFDNFNLDLIYGLPGQTLTQWQKTLQIALQINPQHLSLYALTLEPHVRLYRQIQQGLLPAPDDDLTADMYDAASDMLEQNGFVQYEISNWARQVAPDRDTRCRHNLQYWLNLPYLGFGAGAHGCAAGIRTENLSRVWAYNNRCLAAELTPGDFPRGPALKSAVKISRHREMQETMLLGLRLREGVSAVQFHERFGVQLRSVFGKEIKKLEGLQLLEQNPENTDAIRITRRSRFLSNIVFREFVD